MTDIKQKALALWNDVRAERGWDAYINFPRDPDSQSEALCRAIEQHEAFKQEVSDAVELRFKGFEAQYGALEQFIIPTPKPDPLVEVLTEVDTGNGWDDEEDYARQIHKALEARGLEIREINT